MNAHFWPGINVVDAVQLVQGDSVAQEVIALKGRANPENALASAGTLHIVEKDGDDRDISSQEFGEEILVEEHFIDSIFAGCLDRANDLSRVYEFSFRSDDSFIPREYEIEFIRHLVAGIAGYRYTNSAGFTRQPYFLDDQLDQSLEELSNSFSTLIGIVERIADAPNSLLDSIDDPVDSF